MRHDTDNWEQVRAASQAVLPERIVKHIEQCRKDAHSESHLIGVLHMVQGHFGYLGKDQMDAVAQLLRVPTAMVTGVRPATSGHSAQARPPIASRCSVKLLGDTATLRNSRCMPSITIQPSLRLTVPPSSPEGSPAPNAP